MCRPTKSYTLSSLALLTSDYCNFDAVYGYYHMTYFNSLSGENVGWLIDWCLLRQL
jgi:hypothetical protein